MAYLTSSTKASKVKVEYPLKQGLNYSLKTTTFIQGCFFIGKKRFKYFTLSNF